MSYIGKHIALGKGHNRECCDSKKVLVSRASHRGGDICIWARNSTGRNRVNTLTDHSFLGFKIARACLMNELGPSEILCQEKIGRTQWGNSLSGSPNR